MIKAMKINSIKKVKMDKAIPVYDVINAKPYHNFVVKTNDGEIVSHNCAFL